MKEIIIPAIIAQTQEELNDLLSKVEAYSELVQLDFMDCLFVKKSSLNFDFDAAGSDLRFEAHLMINDPFDWIKKNWTKVDTVIVHIESCEKPEAIINFVKNKGKKIGLAINPETTVNDIKSYLDFIDQLLVMTVVPGAYGGVFLPKMLKKVIEIKKLRPELDIEVDGGIALDTISLARDAGANMFVSGSYILKSSNIEEAVKMLTFKIK